MQSLRSVLTLLLCSGLVFAFGLPGCGDDDEVENGMTCETAVDTLTSETCEQGAVDAVPIWIANCVALCDPPGNEACINDCAFAFITFLPAPCQEAIAYLLHDADPACRECFGGCALAFFPCVLLGGLPQDCVDQASGCLEMCP